MDNINNPIEITTTGSYKYFREFFLFSVYKGRFYRQKPYIVMILLAFTIFMFIARGIDIGFDDNDFTFILFFSIMFIVNILMFTILPAVQYRKLKDYITGTVTYRFKENGFTTEAVSRDINGTSNNKYSSIAKIVNLQDVLLLQMVLNQSFVIYKNTCSNEDVIKINELLKQNVKKCYNYAKKIK